MVLFDIDGTLIRKSGPHHREALVEAVRRVTGLTTTTDGIPLHGMLDPDILAQMLRAAGARPAFIRFHMPALVATAQSVYMRRSPDTLARRVCPGVRRLLAGLDRRGVLLGLVTGNLTKIGWRKLERAGLKTHFRLGVFGEMCRDRTGLVRMVVADARRRRWIGGSTKISMIGDAPADVRAALANRVQAIAVATGISTFDELAAESPDLLVDDLRALPLKVLLS